MEAIRVGTDTTTRSSFGSRVFILLSLTFVLILSSFGRHNEAANIAFANAQGESEEGGGRGEGSGFSLSSLLSLAPSPDTLKQVFTDAAKQASEFLRNPPKDLELGPIQEGLERLTTMLGIKADLRRSIFLQRRKLETVYMPVFVFAQQRSTDNNADADNIALSVILKDKHMVKFQQKYADIEPCRTMSAAPKLLEVHLRQVEDLQKHFVSDEPVVLSLVARLDAVVAEFMETLQGMYSAIARYVNSKERFPKNKRALFFFAKYSLPKILKILLLINSMEASLLRKAEYLTHADEVKNLKRLLREITTQTWEATEALEDFSAGCLIGCSSNFQVDYAASLRDYEEGEKVEIAFRRFLGSPLLEGIDLPSAQGAVNGGKDAKADSGSSAKALDASQFLQVMKSQSDEEAEKISKEAKRYGPSPDLAAPAGAVKIATDAGALGGGINLQEDGGDESSQNDEEKEPKSERQAARDLLDSY
ncbi:kelch motif domain-containing [Cystoisospora suis]|uniref:Kelch motif domain-containing n=1 Tax=Cystoisospora suis TaxID=483139 RepID=A0A2C6KZ67_9APIC|nr:kelch motif domain-containing [Cystoisospora suis]